jgi:hypothetical protein
VGAPNGKRFGSVLPLDAVDDGVVVGVLGVGGLGVGVLVAAETAVTLPRPTAVATAIPPTI